MEDAKTYDQFACWSKNQADNKLKAITKAKDKIAAQKATIEMLEGEIDELNDEIPKMKDKIKKLTKKQKAKDKKRKEEFEKYSKKEKDLAGAIEAVKGAIEALEMAKGSMEGAKLGYTLMQVHSSIKKVVDAAQSGEYTAVTTPEELNAMLELLDLTGAKQQPAGYEVSKGTNKIITTLKDLMKKFKVDKTDLDTTESEARNEYEMSKQSRENTIKFTQEDVDAKEKLVAGKEEEKQTTEEEMEATKEAKKADKKYLDELMEQAEGKAKDFDQRSKARAAELTALGEATEILKGSVQKNYGANKKLNLQQTGSLAPVQDHVAFLQIREQESAPTKVLSFLKQQAQLLNSPILSTVALKVTASAAKDHFVKVRSMIKDLIAKLEADAEAEADQKSFCDEEMGKAIDDRDEANGDVEGATADIDSSESKIRELSDEIKDLAGQIADLRKALFDAKELRGKEKEANEKTLADSKAGLKAVKDAIKVLEEFYGFVQTGSSNADAHRQDQPKTEEGEYEGNKDAASGILGLLDVIVSDFERTIETTEKEEDDAKKKFKDFEKDTESDVEDKVKSKKDKEKDVKSTESDLTGFKEDLKNGRDNLKDAKGELAKLKPVCVDTGPSWEEKRAQQKKDVEALKQALEILENWKS